MAEPRSIPEALPGLVEADLLRLGPCAVCRKPLASDVLFYRLRLERAMFDASALKRRLGLELQIGAPLARFMGPDENLAKIFDGPVEVAVHESCADKVPHLMALWPPEKDEAETSKPTGASA